MADKELRRMSRMELVEVIYAMQQEEQSLRDENAELRRQLEDRTLRVAEAGSMAEAALGLNRVFEDADAAAAQYVESARRAQAEAARALEAARREAEAVVARARERARRAEERAVRGEEANEAIRRAVRERAMAARGTHARGGADG